MIYLDHAATTPTDPRVLEAMLPHLRNTWGNPSSAHKAGRLAHAAMDESRQTIAEILGLKAHEVIFVSSGSEGNSLALFGRAEQWLKEHKSPGHIITLSTEHSCSIKAVEYLKTKGWKITALPVDKDGVMSVQNLQDAFTEDTALVSVQWANSEVGTIQPIEEIASLCKKHDVPFHCDAVQPVGQLPFPKKLPDMMTIAAHKFYGPKGIGVLTVREGVRLQPQVMGGGQEFDLRAGTENVPAMVGMAKALQIAMEEQPTEMKRLTELRDRFIGDLLSLGGTSLNGSKSNRLPNNVNMHFKNHSAETLVIKLDMAGICVSSGSACATGSTEPSHVLQAMGRSDDEAVRNIRFSLGKSTTAAELQTVVRTLKTLL